MQLIVGIDASRIRSGGAVVHLVEILKNLEPKKNDIRIIHLWVYKNLIDMAPEYPG